MGFPLRGKTRIMKKDKSRIADFSFSFPYEYQI